VLLQQAQHNGSCMYSCCCTVQPHLKVFDLCFALLQLNPIQLILQQLQACHDSKQQQGPGQSAEN
jgi:hypothetical protein